jgi:hypothetical protein
MTMIPRAVRFRVRVALGGTASATIGAIVIACSNFREGAVVDQDAADLDGSLETSAVIDADTSTSAPIDGGACDGQAGSHEYASLLVLGGFNTDDSGANLSEAADIVSAPLRCDGSLGSWITLPVELPFTLVQGAVGVIDDHVIVLDGEHSTGGGNFANTVWVAGRAANGSLMDFVSFTVPDLVPRFRVAYTQTQSELIVLGGQGPSGPIDSIETVTLDGGVPSVIARGPMNALRARFAASYINGHVITMSGDGIALADVAADGDIANWRTVDGGREDLDVTSVVSDNRVYFVGGNSADTTLTIATVSGGSVSLGPATLPQSFSATVSVASNGYAYFVSGSLGPTVLRGMLTESGISDLAPLATLPTPRKGHMVVVF